MTDMYTCKGASLMSLDHHALTLYLVVFSDDNPEFNALTLAVLRYNGTNSSALPSNTDVPNIEGVTSSLNYWYGGDLVPADAVDRDVPEATKFVLLLSKFRLS